MKGHLKTLIFFFLRLGEVIDLSRHENEEFFGAPFKKFYLEYMWFSAFVLCINSSHWS